MNLQYVRYALEISRTGSISKAAENLSVAQPNLSRAVKELESQLGIAIFERTRTGMTVTPDGEKLLSAGERILRDVTELETMFSEESLPRSALSVTVTRSAYLSHALVSFCAALPDSQRFDVTYKEADLSRVMADVSSGAADLGVIRIPLHFERYYTEKLAQKDLQWETVAEFTPVILAGMGSPLAGKSTIRSADLSGLCELHSPDALEHDGNRDEIRLKEITVTEQETLYGLLSADPTLYLCTAPMPPHQITKYGLIQRPVFEGTTYRDLLVTRRSYRLTRTDEAFLRALRGTVKSIE